jgi:hypothetical protein
MSLSQEEWDAKQAAGAWKRLPPYEPAPRNQPPTTTTPRRKDRQELNPPVWRALLDGIEADTVDPADIPPEKLVAPTLGAVRRRGQSDEMCLEARVLLATELVLESQRRILIERLDSVMEFLAVGATPDQAMVRVRRLVAEYDDRPELKAAA